MRKNDYCGKATYLFNRLDFAFNAAKKGNIKMVQN